MTLCTSSTQSFTNTDLNALYNGQGPVLPTPTPQGNSTDRDSSNAGLLKKEFLDAHIQRLKTANIIPAEPSLQSTISQDTALAQYTAALNNLVDNLKTEYCFYDARYKYAIRDLFTSIASATSTNATNGSLTAKTDICILLNYRLKDLSQTISAITESINTSTKGLNTNINSLNSELSSYFTKLRGQAEILKSEAPTAEIRKRMVEYTREKAKATNNLLSLYFFLDVVALGMLFYIYKAA